MSATANVTKVDFYEVLAVSREASDQELKASYRKLAMQYHPDRPEQSRSGREFKECSEAYAVLSDPEKRAAMTATAMPRFRMAEAAEIRSSIHGHQPLAGYRPPARPRPTACRCRNTPHVSFTCRLFSTPPRYHKAKATWTLEGAAR